MSASDDRKAKKRKQKKGPVAKTPAQNEATCQNLAETFGLQNPAEDSILSPGLDSETMQKLEKLMDADKDSEIPQLLSLSRGPNPFLDKERCLLCGCERIDPPEAAALRANSPEKKSTNTNSLAQLPLWVCPDCRKSTEQGMDRKANISSFMVHEEPDLPPEPASLPFVDPALDSEPVSPDGTICNCDACTERRQIEAEHDKETQELQNCWTELRKLVRVLYGCREGDVCPEEDQNIPDEEKAKELVHRLCARDPHQLFLRLESQVREFVIEMKVKLLKQLNSGYKTPPEAKAFIQLLLDEYGHLCVVSRKMAEILNKLKNDHLVKFHLTWELHNKHLFQSIAYTEPSIQSSLHLIISQLRLGAASKESYNEDTYPNLLHRYLKFDDEMSVISVVWRDSHQLIEQYNEEQSALKLKQKMLKEDWEFFKAQRKILEDHVAKNSKSPVSHSGDHLLSSSSFEAQFTETMRLMLQGSKPSAEECYCSRCNRKRCPCDECTITHMITCGIINPEALEASNSNHPTFLHDPNRYRIDVSPPSMSSTTSSSGSSSPILVDHERRVLPFDVNIAQKEEQEEEEIQEEIENSQSGEGDEADDDMDLEDDDEDDEDDDYDLIDDDDDDEDDDDEEEEEEEEELNVDTKKEDLTAKLTEISSKSWMNDPDDDGAEELISEKCDCYHCVSQAQAEQMIKLNENSCQCYVCLRQKGQTISTSLPQQVTTETSRPGELHLYPHIHGSSGLHNLPSHHVRPLLPTQLYDLHMPPVRQPKPLLQTSTKVPLKLDFDSPEGIHEHIYHAYGEWDNTYDARMLLPKYGTLGTELLPPPPLTTNFSTTNFLTEPFSVATQTFGNTAASSSSSTSSAFKTSINTALSFATTKGSDSIMTANHDQTAPKVGHTESLNKNLTPPCTRPVPLGGNISQQKGMMAKGDTEKIQHSQHCRHHNSSLINKNAGNNNSITAHNHNNNSLRIQDSVPQDSIQTAARNIRENAKEGMQRIQHFANRLNTNNSHSCNHNLPNAQGHSHNTSASGEHVHIGNCPNSVAMATTVNNVSVGTSTVCMDQDCEGHYDDNCDSVDDSCSEQSSSTSTSNQKEGKYCDCCYCEFFGHGNPPVAPTSKNYAEMRDRLRLRLKRKKEACQDENCLARSNHTKVQKQIESQGLDELIKFINGTDQKDSQNSEKSTKAAKRARQKQRKAEEKARLEAERLRQEEERKEQERKEKKKEMEKNLANAAKIENSKNNQKRKKKKEKSKVSEVLINLTQPLTNDVTRVREPPVGEEGDIGDKGGKNNNTSNKNNNTQSKSSKPAVKVKDERADLKSAKHPGGAKLSASNGVDMPVCSKDSQLSKSRQDGGHGKGTQKDVRTVENGAKIQMVDRAKMEEKGSAKVVITDKKLKVSEQNDHSAKRVKKIIGEIQSSSNNVSEAARKSGSPQLVQKCSKTQTTTKLPVSKEGEQQIRNGPSVLQMSRPQSQQGMVNQQLQGQKQPSHGQVPQPPPNMVHLMKQQVQNQPMTKQQLQQHHQQLLKQQAMSAAKPVPVQNLQQHLAKIVSQQKSGRATGQLQHAQHQVKSPSQPSQAQKNGQSQQQHHHHQQQQSSTKVPQQLVNKQQPLVQEKQDTQQHRQVNRSNQQQDSHGSVSQQSPRLVPQSPRQNHQKQQAPLHNGAIPNKTQDKGRNNSAVHTKNPPSGPVLQNGTVGSSFKHPPSPHPGSGGKGQADGRRNEGNKSKQEDSPSSQEQKGSKSKKNKKKNRNSEDLTTVIDEIFLPKDLSEVENGEMDEVEKELEEFKRFCLDSTPVKREKLQVNMNLKDIFVKKKSGLGCS